MGGAVFIAEDATITLRNVDFSLQTGNAVTQGVGGGADPLGAITLTDTDPSFVADFAPLDGSAGDGGASGSFLFVQSSALNLDVQADATLNPRLFGDQSELSGAPGVFSSPSTIFKTGQGTLTLAGDSDLSTNDSGITTGGLVLSEGGLLIDGSFSSFPFNVNALSGTTVRGTGLVGSIQNDGGRVSPGDGEGAIGELLVFGSYQQFGEANLDIEFGPSDIDLLNVSGFALLDGGLNFVQVEEGVALDTPQTFLAASAIFGEFDNVNATFLNGTALITATVSEATETIDSPVFDPDPLTPDVTLQPAIRQTLQVTFTEVDPLTVLPSAANTSSGAAVAAQVSALLDAGDANGTILFEALTDGAPLVVNGQFNPVFTQGLESQSNAVTNAAAAGAAAAGAQANAVVRARVSGVGLGTRGAPDPLLLNIRSYDDLFLNPSATRPQDVEDSAWFQDATLGEEDAVFENRPFSLWVEGVAGQGDIDTDNNGAGSETETVGITAGAEWVTEDGRTVAGVFVGSIETDIEVDGLSDEGDIDSFLVGVYGSTPLGYGSSINGSLSVGTLDFDSSRVTSLGVASSSSDGLVINGSIEVLGSIQLSRRAVLSPFAGLEASFVDRDGFTESGAGVLNLTVDSENDEYLTGLLGVQWVGSYDLNDDLRLKPAGRVALAAQFLDDSASTTSSFTALPGTSFTSTGAERGEVSVRVGASIELGPRLSNRWGVFARYTGDFSDSAQDNIGQFGVRFAF